MDLDKFIAKALLDIVNGVHNAQLQIGKNAQIMPDTGGNHPLETRGFTPLQIVSFHVTVTVDNQRDSEGKIGVLSCVVGAGMSGKSSSATEHATSLQFNIPIRLPSQPPQTN